MPSFDFVLPHWAYWLTLIIFPLVAAYMARRPLPERREYTKPVAYLILLTGGMIGLHRFYLKSLAGFVYVALFLVILYGNNQSWKARSNLSDANRVVQVAQSTLSREQNQVKNGRARLAGLQARLAATAEGSFARKSAGYKLKRMQDRITRYAARITRAKSNLEKARPEAASAKSKYRFWERVSGYSFYIILALMAIDAVLLPQLIRRANASIAIEPDLAKEANAVIEPAEGDDTSYISSGWTGWIDRIALYSGEFVSYWVVIAVFILYFTVISRYVFNSPFIWSHQAMFLMFGMQYLIAGAYAVLTDSNVRVDVFYAALPRRKKAWVDLLTSVFFFIFAGTLLITSYIFAHDSLTVAAGNSVISEWARGKMGFFQMLGSLTISDWTDPNIRWGEVSVDAWKIPLWPMKWVMVIGTFLLILEGVSKVVQDIKSVVMGD